MDRTTLEFLQEASIGTISISDHAPVNVALTLPLSGHRTWTWRLNVNLLDDEAVVKRVSDTLTHYFRENLTDDVSEGVVWEAHKTMARG